MAYNEELADRISSILGDRDDLVDKKMFGGIAFMLHGNMSVGITGDDLMLRIGAENHDEVLARPHARPMDFTGKAMKGFVYVGPEGYETDDELLEWVDLAVDFAMTLPPK